MAVSESTGIIPVTDTNELPGQVLFRYNEGNEKGIIYLCRYRPALHNKSDCGQKKLCIADQCTRAAFGMSLYRVSPTHTLEGGPR
jgi:hypothetical protein